MPAMRRLLLCSALLLAACGRQQDEPAGPPSPTPVASPAPAPSSSPAADLSRYVGAYPTEPTGGGPSFLRQPAVRDAVAAVLPDAALRDLVLGSDVTATPIALVDGKLLAFGCEPHNCGPHNWAIAIRPDGHDAAVCLYDEDRRVARWYPDGAAAAPVNGCPSGE